MIKYINGDEDLQLITHTFMNYQTIYQPSIQSNKKLNCNCIIWSAGQEFYVNKMCSLLDPFNKYIDGIIAYGSWFENTMGKIPHYWDLTMKNTIN